MKVTVQKLDGKASGDIELDDAVFGVEPRAASVRTTSRFCCVR